MVKTIKIDSISAVDRQNFTRGVITWVVLMNFSAGILVGPIFSKYVIKIGISNKIIGLFGGLGMFLPYVAALLLGGIIESRGLRQRVFRIGYLFRFILPFGFLIIPFLPGGGRQFPGIAIYGFVTCGFMISALVANICMESLQKDIILPDRFGAFFSKRMTMRALYGLIPAIVLAFLADRFDSILAFQLILGMAAIIGLSIPVVTRGIPEIIHNGEIEKVNVSDIFHRIISPLKDRSFRYFCLTRFINSLFCAGPMYFIVYMLLRQISISLTALMLVSVLATLFIPLYSWFWGQLCDKFGARNTMVVSSVIYSVVALSLVLPINRWVAGFALTMGLSTELAQSIGTIALGGIVVLLMGIKGGGGIFGTGISLSLTALRNEFAVPGQTMLYSSTLLLIGAFGGLISTSSCGFIIDSLANRPIMGLDSYRIVMLFGLVIGGVISGGLFFLLEDKRNFTTNISQMWHLTLNPVPFRDFFLMRRWTRPVGLSEQQQTAKRIIDKGGKLSRLSLLDALNSPSISVRRQTILGLGNFRDKEVRKTLRSIFSDNKGDFRKEAGGSLLKIGNRKDIKFVAGKIKEMEMVERAWILMVAISIGKESMSPVLEEYLKINDLEQASEALLALAKPGKVDNAVWALEKLRGSELSDGARARMAIAAGTCSDPTKKFYSICWQERSERGAAVSLFYVNAGEKALIYYEKGDFPMLARLVSQLDSSSICGQLNCSVKQVEYIKDSLQALLREKKDIYVAILALFLLSLNEKNVK